MFSIVRADDGVYLICTGRAMGARGGGGVAGASAGAILDRVAARRADQIEAAEARLRDLGPAAVKDTRHSRFLPRASIEQVTIKGGDGRGWPVVVIRAGKKLKLHFQTHTLASVRAFFEPFTAA